jgi:hypothetical protein
MTFFYTGGSRTAPTFRAQIDASGDKNQLQGTEGRVQEVELARCAGCYKAHRKRDHRVAQDDKMRLTLRLRNNAHPEVQ